MLKIFLFIKLLIIRAVVGDLRALLEKKVFCGVHRNSRLDYLKSKNQKDFVNIIDYLVINRRNKQNIDFQQNGGFSKKNFDFASKFRPLIIYKVRKKNQKINPSIND